MDALPSDFPQLKGADYIVAESAKSLGLPVCVKPFLSNNRADENFGYALKDFSQRMSLKDCYDEENAEFDPLQIFGDDLCRFKSQDITWCQNLLYHQPAGVTMRYEDEVSLDLWYKSAAILIRIPKWSEFCRRLIAISTGDCYDITGAEDGAVKEFNDIMQDVVHDEVQGLNKQINELLDISAVEELMDELKKIQIDGHLSNPADNIPRIKNGLEHLRDQQELKLFMLRRSVDKLKNTNRSLQ